MARAVRKVVTVERLRDQVYQLIRDDLNVGLFAPGQRLVEAELAGRYEVSRTPVREALFQLSREGLLVRSSDRGYEVPYDTREKARDRHEVRDLLDPILARHAAIEARPDQRRNLTRCAERMQVAHDAAKLNAFAEANVEFRSLLREMCGNELLARCSALVDDQAIVARRGIFANEEDRGAESRYSTELAKAIAEADAAAAEAVMRAYIQHARGASLRLPE
jgi:DNA-binding GntR family transcriptional regulator